MDIPERQVEVKAEEQSQELEQLRLAVNFFDQLFNGIQDIILVIDPQNHKIGTFNQAALNGLELSEADLLGINCYKLFYNQTAPCQLPLRPCPIEQILKTKNHTLTEYEYTTPSKQLKYFEVSVNLISDQRNDQPQVVYVLRDITVRKQEEGKDTGASYKDQLTNLYNEAFFKHQLGVELSRTKRYDRPLSLVVLGIDNLVAFNALSLVEKSGFLRMIGWVINNNIRSIDSGYNCGANKFQLILPETDETNALVFAGRLRQVFKSRVLQIPLRKESIFSHWTISIGIAGFLPGDNAETLTAKTLSALQKAQTGGGDRICTYHLEGNSEYES